MKNFYFCLVSLDEICVLSLKAAKFLQHHCMIAVGEFQKSVEEKIIDEDLKKVQNKIELKEAI